MELLKVYGSISLRLTKTRNPSLQGLRRAIPRNPSFQKEGEKIRVELNLNFRYGEEAAQQGSDVHNEDGVGD